MKRNLAVSLILGIAVSGVTLYLAFRNVPFHDLVDYLSSINYFWMIPSVLTICLAFALRALRWQIILKPVKGISYWGVFHPMMIGFMMNCVLPGRLGEMARPAILKKRDHVPFASGLATVAVERIFDIGLLLLLFNLMITLVQIDPEISVAFGDYQLDRQILLKVANSMVHLSALFFIAVFWVGYGKTRQWTNYLILKLPAVFFFTGNAFKRKISEKVCFRMVNTIDNLASGFAPLKSLKRILTCTGLSFMIWGLSAFSYYVFAFGCPGVQLSFFEMTAVMIIVCFFIALPSVPGFWGLWEAGGVFAMSLFGISKQDAAGFTLANHAIQIFPVILIGIVSAVVTGSNILETFRKRENEDADKSQDRARLGMLKG